MVIRKLPGAHQVGQVTLERSQDGSPNLQDWQRRSCSTATSRGPLQRHDQAVRLNQGGESRAWNFENAWPSKYTTTDPDATRTRSPMETVTIQHEGSQGDMSLRTEFPFTLPKGYVDESGTLHRRA